LDAGTFEAVEISAGTVRVTFGPATPHTPEARLRVEQPAVGAGGGTIVPAGTFTVERDAYVVPLNDGPTQVVLRATA
jgi:hypothetical protein